MNQKEIWKDIPKYERLYKVSNYGNVKSMPKRIGRYNRKNIILLKPKLHKSGYIQYCLTKNGVAKSFLAHRIVAETFIDNHMNKSQVNHIDGNKANNQVINLEWCTPKENTRHAHDNNLVNHKLHKKVLYANSMKMRKEVIQYDINMNFIQEWDSQSDAARYINVDPKAISDCCYQKRKSVNGFIYEFKIKERI